MDHHLSLLLRCDSVSRLRHISRHIWCFNLIIFQPSVVAFSRSLINLSLHDKLWWRGIVSELIVDYWWAGCAYRARVRQLLVNELGVLLSKLERRNQELMAAVGKLRTIDKLVVCRLHYGSRLSKWSSASVLLPWLVWSAHSLLLRIPCISCLIVSLRAIRSVLWIVRLITVFQSHLLDIE